MALKIIDDTPVGEATAGLESFDKELQKMEAALAAADGGTTVIEPGTEDLDAQIEKSLEAIANIADASDVGIAEAEAKLDASLEELAAFEKGAGEDDKDKDKDDKGDKEKKPKKKSDDDKSDDDDSDDDSDDADGDIDEDDDEATEALREAAFGLEAFDAMADTVEAQGGVQPSVVAMTSKLLKQDMLDSVSVQALESLGTSASEDDVEAAIEGLWDTIKDKITNALTAVGRVIGRMGEKMEDLIAKIPGGAKFNAAANAAQKKISTIPHKKAVWIIGLGTAALVGLTTLSAMILGAKSLSLVAAVDTKLGLRAAAEGGEAAKFGPFSESVAKWISNLKSFGSKTTPKGVREAVREATKVETGTAAELGWTEAAWEAVKGSVLKVFEGFKRLWKNICTAVKSVPRLFDDTKAIAAKSTYAEAAPINQEYRAGAAALIRVTRFLEYISGFVFGTIIIGGCAKVAEACRKLAAEG